MNDSAKDILEKASRWKRVKSLFHLAIQQPPEKRGPYLAEACGGDLSLQSEVERLIINDSLADSFLEESAAEEATQLIILEQQRDVEGRRIGPYRLLREIGYGGMGTVYLAERADAQYEKQVAIKLIRLGIHDESMVDRFRRERQILASLDHPNIAKLLDGGTIEERLPYLVMEFIEGLPIDEYCDQHRLSILQRLEMFRKVCSAVQYAHRNLIVHRDIKPSNILVTADDAPRLLDFGIAKIVDPALSVYSRETTATLRLMTFEYASPEQVRGQPITTASDIYSLGVLLYRLLTGHSPYSSKSRLAPDRLRAICEEAPERPSLAIARLSDEAGVDGSITPDSISRNRATDRLRRRLAGDLDNISLKAIRKEPDRRYASVEQFSEDIRRHIEGLPVIACKDTLVYRTGKFIRRHKEGVAAAALILIILLSGIVATMRQARIAQRRFDDVRKLANSLLFEIHGSIENLPGSTPARKLLVTRALEYLDKLSAEAGDDPQLLGELAAAYGKVGDVQGNPYRWNLGQYAAALESYRKSLAISQTLLRQKPDNKEVRQGTAVNHLRIGDMLATTGELEGSLKSYNEALSVYQQLLAEDPTNRSARYQMALVYQGISQIQGNILFPNMGRTADALDSQRKALEIFELFAAEDFAAASAQYDLAVGLHRMGQLLWVSGDNARALEFYERALTICKTLSKDDPVSAVVSQFLAASYESVGDAQFWIRGDLAAALENYRQMVGIRESLSVADPQNMVLSRDLALCHTKTGDVLIKMNRLPQALENYNKAFAIFRSLVAIGPDSIMARCDLLGVYQRMGDIEAKFENFAGAIEYHSEALAQAEALAREVPDDKRVHLGVVICHHNLGDVLSRMGLLDQSLESYRRQLAVAQQLAAVDPGNTVSQFYLVLSYSRIGQTLSAMASRKKTPRQERIERWREARAWLERGLGAFLDMKERGSLAPADAHEIDEVEKGLSLCDAALARLQQSSDSTGK